MKKISFFILFICLVLLFPVTVCAENISARSYCLLEADTGEVVLSENADEKMGMASTTKIMTSLIAIENGDLQKKVAVDDKAIGVEGSSVYLQKGEVLTLEQLLYCVMLQSANDAAAAVAIDIGGSLESFTDMMNAKCEELELHSTHFTNPHGLYDENHYTTASDLAVLSRYALENPTFAKIVSTKNYTVIKDEDNTARTLSNHNRLLREYQGCIGVKTGYTVKCGRCLVSAAEKDGVRLICVTLNDGNDWSDHKKLLDLGFSKYKRVCLEEKNALKINLPVVGGNLSSVTLSNNEEFSCVVKQNDSIDKKIFVNRFLFAPVSSGQEIGYEAFYKNGVEIGRIVLTSEDFSDITSKDKTITEKIRSFIWKK